MSDNRKPGSAGSDDPWARFEALDREAGTRRNDLDPLDEEPAEDDWLDDDDFRDDDEDALDEELFDDEVAALPTETRTEPAAPVEATTPVLRASRDDDDPTSEQADSADSDHSDEFDPYEDEDEDEPNEADEDASGDEEDDDEYDDEYDDDEPDAPLPVADTYSASSDALQPRGAAVIAAAAGAALARPAASLASQLSNDDLDDDDADYSQPRRDVPWLLLGAGALALVLLLAGGYGVMQQRNDLQAEIRQLRARLATTPNTESIAAVREEQAQLQAQNAELATAYQALQQEAERLQSALEELRAAPAAAPPPAARTATATATPAAAKPAAASPAPAATRSVAAQPAAAPTRTVAGDWFVNFAAYREEATAKSWASRLKVTKGTVEVQQIQTNGQRLYRVRVSNLASRADANEIARALGREHKVSPLVGQE
jgi:cell division septation protein DedD